MASCPSHAPSFIRSSIPRRHRIKRAGAGLEYLFDHANDLFVVHEIFLGVTGDLLYTVCLHALRVMSWRTLEHRTIWEFNAWHITPNRAGTKVLCDTIAPAAASTLIGTASLQPRLAMAHQPLRPR